MYQPETDVGLHNSCEGAHGMTADIRNYCRVRCNATPYFNDRISGWRVWRNRRPAPSPNIQFLRLLAVCTIVQRVAQINHNIGVAKGCGGWQKW